MSRTLDLARFDGPPYAYRGRCAGCGATLRANAGDPKAAEREMARRHGARACARERRMRA